MARQARIDYPGAFHHIMMRGFKKEVLFDDTEDYEYCYITSYLSISQQTLSRYVIAIQTVQVIRRA